MNPYQNELYAVILFMVGVAFIAFYLGWTAAESRERRANQTNQRYYQRRIREISKWARENWPNEHAAFHNGHKIGYQQGVLDSPALERDARDDQ